MNPTVVSKVEKMSNGTPVHMARLVIIKTLQTPKWIDDFCWYGDNNFWILDHNPDEDDKKKFLIAEPYMVSETDHPLIGDFGYKNGIIRHFTDSDIATTSFEEMQSYKKVIANIDNLSSIFLANIEQKIIKDQDLFNVVCMLFMSPERFEADKPAQYFTEVIDGKITPYLNIDLTPKDRARALIDKYHDKHCKMLHEYNTSVKVPMGDQMFMRSQMKQILDFIEDLKLMEEKL